VWQHQTQDIVRSSPVVWQDLVFVGSDDGYLYGLGRETGEAVWRYRTGGAIAAAPVAYGERLFVSSTDRRLHAFDIAAEPASGASNP
jgi:outer membrane protein assembly factor BamB